jgi:CheY-like chemotaxis protein
MRKPRILVADDEPAIRKFVRANLEARDYETILVPESSHSL